MFRCRSEHTRVLQHRYARGDGRSGFASPDLGQRLRRLAFTSHGMQPPEQAQLPRTITVFRAAEGEEARLSAPPAGASACVVPVATTCRAPLRDNVLQQHAADWGAIVLWYLHTSLTSCALQWAG